MQNTTASSTNRTEPIEIEYSRAAGQSLLLDVYPQPLNTNAPVALIIHGGGWSAGDKRDDPSFIDILTRAGVVCVSINYRLAPQHPWPACLQDVQSAITWTHEHAKAHGGDTTNLTVTGYSAGGHLALLAPMLQERNYITGMVGLAAPTDMVLDNFRRGGLSASMQKLFGQEHVDHNVLEKLWEISPINHARPGLPRCLLIHGTEDQAVPFNQSQHLKTRLDTLGVACSLLELTGLPHAIAQWSAQRPDTFDVLARWITRTGNTSTASPTD